MRALGAFLLVVACLPCAGLARAQEPAAPPASAAPQAAGTDVGAVARQRYNAGLAAYRERRFVEAALLFEGAAAERAHAVSLYTAAVSWEQASRPDRAADDYVRCIAVQGLGLDKLVLARERIAALEASLGRVEATGPEAIRVQLDTNTELPLPAVLHALPGVHTLSVRAGEAVIEQRSVVLESGTTLHVELSLPTAKPNASPAVVTAPEPRVETVRVMDTRRTVGLAIAGAGAATLVGGVILGVSALGARDAYDTAPTQSSYDHAGALETWTNVAFVAGGVLTVGGLVLAFWPHAKPASSVRVGAGFGRVVVGGTF